MKDQMDLVVSLVALNRGTLVGKTRLQKTFYILDQLKLDSGFEFEYHNYGPFSAELAHAVDDAVLLDLIEVEEKPGYHSVPYSTYKTKEDAPENLGTLPGKQAKGYLEILESYSSLDLEIAATILFFKELGADDAIEQEVKLRKPLKATPVRLGRAWKLLEKLNLAP